LTRKLGSAPTLTRRTVRGESFFRSPRTSQAVPGKYRVKTEEAPVEAHGFTGFPITVVQKEQEFHRFLDRLYNTVWNYIETVKTVH
jgi:hypothetical protein